MGINARRKYPGAEHLAVDSDWQVGKERVKKLV